MALATRKSEALARRVDTAVGLWLSVLTLTIHAVFSIHAGALWRDEVQIFNISTAPSFSEQWQLNEHDTFPLLWQLILRAWTATGFGGTDAGLRVLGFLVGAGILAALWHCARQLEVEAPLVSIVLFAMNPTVFIFGDSIRGYGFGMIGLLLMIASIWRIVFTPSRRNFAWAGASVLFAVQSFYFSVIFFALLAGLAMAIFLRRRAWKAAISLSSIGAIAALSMLPYLDVLQRQGRWFTVLAQDVSVLRLAARMTRAINASGNWMIFVWVVLIALALRTCLLDWSRAGPDAEGERTKDRALFIAGMIVAGTLGFLLFLKWRRHPTQAWYYIAWMGVLSVAIEVGVARFAASVRSGWRWRSMVAAGMGLLVFFTSAWTEAQTRMTNVDRIAAEISRNANEQDLVVIQPWWPGLTFNRYYTGPAPWTTLPDLGPLRVQRFDLFASKLLETDPIRPVLERMEDTLRAGHHVWVVGELPTLATGEDPGTAPPPPVGPLAEEPYMRVWSRQAAHFIRSHSATASPVPVAPNERISPYENLKLTAFKGWRER